MIGIEYFIHVYCLHWQEVICSTQMPYDRLNCRRKYIEREHCHSHRHEHVNTRSTVPDICVLIAAICVLIVPRATVRGLIESL